MCAISGVIEVDGLPTRPKLKNAAHLDPEDASATPTSDEQDHKREHGAHLRTTRPSAQQDQWLMAGQRVLWLTHWPPEGPRNSHREGHW
jgi:hypothetical protein